MRKAGFTGTQLPVTPSVLKVNEETGEVQMRFSDDGVAVLKKAGLGANPKQLLMTGQLGIARAISRKLQPSTDNAGSPVDKNPGCEFDHPKFKDAWFSALRQYKQYLDSLQIPYAIEIVDEPREVPNPWNRNLKHTCLYGDWMGEIGFTTRFVTPMGDGGALDYTELVDHTDIISIHAGVGSAKMEKRTVQSGKTLWFYNTSKSRFGWGVYPWARSASGRWEWHWCDQNGDAHAGYPGNEWYNPFTAADGYNCSAPWSKFPGGFLYKTGMVTIADGITDYAYIYNLEQAISKNKAAGTKGDIVQKATDFLAEIKKSIPEYPHGQGEESADANLDSWRSQIAEFLKKLQ
jgi:hypothetical protein